MKRVFFIMIGATALLTLLAGCATTTTTSTHDEERSMLVASGFKMVTPKTAAQHEKLQHLQTGQVAMIHKEGKAYYIVADPSRNVVYVGDLLSIRLINTFALKGTLRKRPPKLRRCMKTKRWTGVDGVAGGLAGEQWVTGHAWAALGFIKYGVMRSAPKLCVADRLPIAFVPSYHRRAER